MKDGRHLLRWMWGALTNACAKTALASQKCRQNASYTLTTGTKVLVLEPIFVRTFHRPARVSD